MRASVGGIVNIFLLLVFIVVISSLLLFNVTYAKAFRVKDKIITLHEQYEGVCTSNTQCAKKIEEYEKKLGYEYVKITPTADEKCIDELGFCYTRMCISSSDNSETSVCTDDDISSLPNGAEIYYRIRTAVAVDFPFLDSIIGNGIFRVTGETKKIYVAR